MLNSARDEMLILLLTVHLHLERSVLDGTSAKLSTDLVELLDVMRGEYARRSDRDRLHLDDLNMADYDTSSTSLTPFRLRTFCLRPHTVKTERYWGILQVIAILERLVILGELRTNPSSDVNDNDAGKHPRKRQRLAQPSDRLLDPIKSEDENVRLIALQVLLFVLEDYRMETHTLVELLSQLRICTSDKRGHIASWALLAIAR
jgi:ataxia telangiectasia mutated family protein